MNILPPRTFYPVGWFDVGALHGKKTDTEWEKLFAGSFTVHLFHSSQRSDAMMMKPKYYGHERPALVYLATKQCPTAFNSVKLF